MTEPPVSPQCAMFSQFLPSHLVPFAELSPWLIGAVALAHFAGFFIRGAFGFGSNMPIVLATTWLLSPHHAIILVMLTATAAQVHLMPQGVRAADWRRRVGKRHYSRLRV